MNASCSLFSQILKLILHPDFERIVNKTGAEYRSWVVDVRTIPRRHASKHPPEIELKRRETDRPSR